MAHYAFISNDGNNTVDAPAGQTVVEPTGAIVELLFEAALTTSSGV